FRVTQPQGCTPFSQFFPDTAPPQPTSTLFPYTTLFRSRHDSAARAIRPAVRGLPRGGRRRSHFGARRGGSGIPAHAPAELQNEIDRKSTRLNSSHVAISYAVFCLKKKKQVSLVFMFGLC